MASTKELKQRIKGIKNTGKITRAMEMISAVKMRKSVAKVMAIRPYAKHSMRVFSKAMLRAKQEGIHLFQDRLVKKALFVVVTSNRGLCGSFNSQVMRRVASEIEKIKKENTKIEKIDFISIGKKGDRMLRRFDAEIIASFPDIISHPNFDEVRSIRKMVQDDYVNGQYDKVMLVYTDYVSPMTQKPKARQLLPTSYDAIESEILEMTDSKHGDDVSKENDSNLELAAQYKMEPGIETVLQSLVPRLIEVQLYHAILESDASQEAARMIAMRNATDAAKEMAEDFTLTYNQLRQAKVTQEIAELSAGMAAVEG